MIPARFYSAAEASARAIAMRESCRFEQNASVFFRPAATIALTLKNGGENR